MNKLFCLCLLCLFGIVPSASAQYAGGKGDGYDRAGQRRSFPAYVNLNGPYAGGKGDGYDSGSASLRVTRYVATMGSDGDNDCTNPSNKCATLAHAVNQANARDIIDLATGTYTALGLVIDKALTLQGVGVIVQ